MRRSKGMTRDHKLVALTRLVVVGDHRTEAVTSYSGERFPLPRSTTEGKEGEMREESEAKRMGGS